MAGNGAERILNHYLMAQSVLRAQVMLRTAAPRLSLAALSCGCPADGVRLAFCSSSLHEAGVRRPIFLPQPRVYSRD
jgi:hypothetical protein